MPKTVKVNGTDGNFGSYGGVKNTSIYNKGYNQKVCCLCPGVAFYHCGGDGYCELHKDDAVKRYARFRNKALDIFIDELVGGEPPDVDLDAEDIKLLKAKGPRKVQK